MACRYAARVRYIMLAFSMSLDWSCHVNKHLFDRNDTIAWIDDLNNDVTVEIIFVFNITAETDNTAALAARDSGNPKRRNKLKL